MKLEGAGGGPFQTIMLVGIEDPAVLEDVDSFIARMERGLRDHVDPASSAIACGARASPASISSARMPIPARLPAPERERRARLQPS